MTIKEIKEMNERTNKRDEENRKRRNKLIDEFGIAYKIKDRDGNVFIFVGIENDCPLYRGLGGCTHIFNLKGYEVIQKYDEVV